MQINPNTLHRVHFYLIAIIFASLLVITQKHFLRVDLTQDKRYTLSENSKQVLKQINDVIYYEIYLAGDLPSGFQLLQKAIKETLDELNIYAKVKIKYVFKDPFDESNPKKREALWMELAQNGLQPTNIFLTEKGKQIEKLVFPGALVHYKNKTLPLIFLKNNPTQQAGESLNQSIESLEFECVSAIQKLISTNKPKLGYIIGHNEPVGAVITDFIDILKEFYKVEFVNAASMTWEKKYDVLMIAKPQKPFTETEKLWIDQHIMSGKNLLVLLDKVEVNPGKIGSKDDVSFAYDLNLDDLLFKYGVRINNELVKDLQSGALPMVVGYIGNQPQTRLMPWLYYPIASNFSSHAVAKNNGPIMFKYLSPIDTVKAVGISKTPLLYSSAYSKVQSVPFSISLEEARTPPNPKDYFNKPLMGAVLLEGRFKSLYHNRLPQQLADSILFKATGSAAKIIVVGDGDIALNEVGADTTQIFPLGYNRYMAKKFANKDFLQNCIAYLSPSQALLNTRLKEFTYRPLDKNKIDNERTYWQVLNVVVPLLILAMVGVARYYYRSKIYS